MNDKKTTMKNPIKALLNRWSANKPCQPAGPIRYLDMDSLNQRLGGMQVSYKNGSPFPHIVIDNFISAEGLSLILDHFPESGQSMQRVPRTAYLGDGRPAQINKRNYSEAELSPVIQQLLFELHSGFFIQWLEKVTDIPGLLSDPHYKGGGVHVTDRGGLLRVHADFNKHPITGLDRRINLLLFLNEDWKEEYGGHLELWDKDVKTCEKRILPISCRCVIFNTTSDSFHGHPHPLTCPDSISRKSIALYYYSNGRPDDEAKDKHATLWPETPGEEGKQ